MNTITELRADLHALDDYLAGRHAELPEGVRAYLSSGALMLQCADAEAFAAAIRWMGGGDKGTDSVSATVTRTFGALRVEAWVMRDEVCERRVVGTRTVTVPDPEALAKVPTVEVTEDVTEWVCGPFLGTEAETVPA